MENQDTTNLLLEAIRKELVSITQGRSESNLENSEHNLQKNARFLEDEVGSNNVDDTSENRILSTYSSICPINIEIQKMQSNLDESSKFFQNIRQNFEKINFGCLRSRIRDLHLNEQRNDAIKIIVDDLKEFFDEKYIQNRVEDLTKEVTMQFRQHPGEFGDIPELSEFFRTCTQLQHAIEKLQKYKENYQDLERRISQVVEASYNRFNDIERKINETEENKNGPGSKEDISNLEKSYKN